MTDPFIHDTDTHQQLVEAHQACVTASQKAKQDVREAQARYEELKDLERQAWLDLQDFLREQARMPRKPVQWEWNKTRV